MGKYEGKIEKYEIENNFVSEIKILQGAEDVYKSGDFKNLKNLKKVNMSWTAIGELEELTADKLPKGVEEINDRGCKKLKKCSLKGLKNLKRLWIACSAIKKLGPTCPRA
ncbi:MAG: hypothetical protein QXE64_02215 [Candidatus Pacearchaeota archaeon]